MEDLPPISVCTPIWNRNHFLPLMIRNLTCQTYPREKLTWVVDDDGDEPLVRTGRDLDKLAKAIAPVKLRYHYYRKRRAIGVKRNNLARICPDDIFCHMDSDDLYNKEYISYSRTTLVKEKAGLCGSKSMVFVYPFHGFSMSAIHCRQLVQIHENTMMMTKEYYNNSRGFARTSRGEGASVIIPHPQKAVHTEIDRLVVTVCHGPGNIVDKEMFRKKTIDRQLRDQDKTLIKQILNID